MFQNLSNSPNTPPAKLTASVVVEQLRAMQSQIDGLYALSAAERDVSRKRAGRQPAPVIAASMSVISSSDTVAQAVGVPVDEVLQIQQDESEWALVAGELRKFLKEVEGANMLRREKLALIASQAYSIGMQLVRDPANADLLPHVEEIKRLKSTSRRKKAPPAPEAPA